MKKILVPIDFSATSQNAAHYAASLACSIQARVELMNVFQVPVESPMAASLVWPLEEYAQLENQSREGLKNLADNISSSIRDSYEVLDFKPPITTHAAAGEVTDEISQYFRSEKMNLVVAGINKGKAFSRFLLGSKVRQMIERSHLPLMLIPEDFKFKKLHKIAFATDLNSGDVRLLCLLVALAEPFDAEILIMHAADSRMDDDQSRQGAENFLNEVAGKVDYRKIYYRHVNSQRVKDGLDWIVENGQIDLLVMVHRKHRFLERILKGSYTKQMASHIDLPLLVLSPDQTFSL